MGEWGAKPGEAFSWVNVMNYLLALISISLYYFALFAIEQHPVCFLSAPNTILVIGLPKKGTDMQKRTTPHANRAPCFHAGPEFLRALLSNFSKTLPVYRCYPQVISQKANPRSRPSGASCHPKPSSTPSVRLPNPIWLDLRRHLPLMLSVHYEMVDEATRPLNTNRSCYWAVRPI